MNDKNIILMHSSLEVLKIFVLRFISTSLLYFIALFKIRFYSAYFYFFFFRERLGGVKPPVLRSETDFDPGSKYHVPANIPYIG